MRLIPCLVLLCSALLRAQTPAAEPAPDTVLASFEGKTVTYGQIKEFVIAMAPPEQQRLMLGNLTYAVHQYFLWQHLADMALNEKLDQKSPTRERLYWDRVNVLMQALINEVSNETKADQDDLQKYYEANKGKYTQVKVKTIYVSFVANPEAAGAGDKKVLSEDEAKTKIAGILKEIRAGADFVAMVKKYSEDEASRAKNGDFETFHMSDEIPDAVRAAVFKLKQGEVSEPVRQPNGYYLFRAEEISTRTFQQVQTEIYDTVRQQNFRKWLDKMNKSINYKIEKPEFFKPAAPTLPAPTPSPVPK